MLPEVTPTPPTAAKGPEGRFLVSRQCLSLQCVLMALDVPRLQSDGVESAELFQLRTLQGAHCVSFSTFL